MSHDNLMNFLNKKYTQLAPIEEAQNQSKKENDIKPLPTYVRVPSEGKLKPQQRKLKSASSQNNINNNNHNNNDSPGTQNDLVIDARDFLWENNYKIKLMINQYKDDNSKLKAKIGNLEVKFISLIFFR